MAAGLLLGSKREPITYLSKQIHAAFSLMLTSQLFFDVNIGPISSNLAWELNEAPVVLQGPQGVFLGDQLAPNL